MEQLRNLGRIRLLQFTHNSQTSTASTPCGPFPPVQASPSCWKKAAKESGPTVQAWALQVEDRGPAVFPLPWPQ